MHWVSELLRDTLAAILGGGALTCLIFLIREYIAPLPEINGPWYLQIETESSAYNPYVGMFLKFEVIIWQEGAVLHGSTETIYESSSTVHRQMEGDHRINGVLDGYVSKYYFRKDRIRLNITQDGEFRVTTLYIDLIQKGPELKGRFMWSAASSRGKAILSRTRNSQNFDRLVQTEHSDQVGDIVARAEDSTELTPE